MNTPDVEKVLNSWNQGIRLGSPTLEDFRNLRDVDSIQPVFDHTPYLLYAGCNLLITLRQGGRVSNAGRVQSLSVIFVSDFFSSGALVSTSDLPELEIFGIPTTISADEFLRALKGQGIEPTSIETEPATWIFRCGDALKFEFRSSEPNGTSAGRSELIQIEYNYNLPYRGERAPLLVRKK